MSKDAESALQLIMLRTECIIAFSKLQRQIIHLRDRRRIREAEMLQPELDQLGQRIAALSHAIDTLSDKL